MRDLFGLAEQFGCTVERTRSQHIRLRHPSGWFVITSFTPSCHRVFKNVRSSLRRKAAGK